MAKADASPEPFQSLPAPHFGVLPRATPHPTGAERSSNIIEISRTSSRRNCACRTAARERRVFADAHRRRAPGGNIVARPVQERECGRGGCTPDTWAFRSSR